LGGADSRGELAAAAQSWGEHATRGAVAAAVERKAGGRRGREGGVGAAVEPVAERMRDFF
jgi:hypothetical protein